MVTTPYKNRRSVAEAGPMGLQPHHWALADPDGEFTEVHRVALGRRDRVWPSPTLTDGDRLMSGNRAPHSRLTAVLVATGFCVLAGLVSNQVLAMAARARARRGAEAIVDNGVPRRAVLLTSAYAGSAGQLDRARAAIAAVGFTIIAQIPVEEHERLAEWLSGPAEHMPLVVAAGGDGTVGAAANYVVNTGAVLGVLPLGTSNDFARSLGLPTDPVRAARLFATGKIATIDAGRWSVPGEPARYFVHAATVGLNVSFARLATKASLRQRFGRLTYAVAAATALRQRDSFSCELHYDGRVEHRNLVHLSVINAPVFGGFLGMRVIGASLDDRILDVIAVEHLPVRRLLLAALHPILRLKRPIRGICTLRVRSIRVQTTRVLDVALDGEILGKVPADFEVAGEALRVITPLDFEDIDD
jgi:diacylglycerol kinase (ATP)